MKKQPKGGPGVKRYRNGTIKQWDTRKEWQEKWAEVGC